MPSDLHTENAASRRDFLLSTGVFAAGILGAGYPAAGMQESSASQPATRPTATPADDRPLITTSGVTKATLAEAEKLAGIQFTDAEREMMVKTIGEQLAFIRERRNQSAPPNWLSPATVFTPILPEVDVTSRSTLRRRELKRSTKDPGPLPTRDEDIAYAPLTSLSRWIERRELTSARLTQIYLDRLYRLDPQLKAVITFCEARARRQAARADVEIAAGTYRGPLHGIPWGAKDLIDTEGIRTTWGAEPFTRRIPEYDAAVVRKLDEAGAILIAKLSVGALAYNDIWFGGRTRNPWNLEQGSSGSSAGSAAATAAGMVGFSLGTETYGSIVSPCMRCGTTGLRPTFGRVSRSGVMALCWSLDKIGPICRSVEDTILVLDAINGGKPDQADPSTLDLPVNFDVNRSVTGLRIGYVPRWFEGDESHRLDRAALEALGRTGVKLVEIELPQWPYESLLMLLLCEAAAAFEELTRMDIDDQLKWQDPEAWPNTFRKSWFIPGVELVQAQRFRRRCMLMMAEKMEHLDAIIAPSFAGHLCLLTNNTGHPSLTLRTGFKEDLSPHGISMIGKLFDEGTLCRIGVALEEELGVWHKRPPLG